MYASAAAKHKQRLKDLHGGGSGGHEHNQSSESANGTAEVDAGRLGLQVVVDAGGSPGSGMGVGVPAGVQLKVPVSVDGNEMTVTIENGQTPEAVSEDPLKRAALTCCICSSIRSLRLQVISARRTPASAT